jgi:hypothetical protein
MDRIYTKRVLEDEVEADEVETLVPNRQLYLFLLSCDFFGYVLSFAMEMHYIVQGM